ncbi:hypothetical protein [Pseudomonas phage vB_PseuGesM_254]|uniref:Uncharacterized protein n=1 Tax=Pseudomonas phage vB_PseuGesM_254 TaxID=3092638 RepID=A0AAX4G7S3_9CAUD|nr:hypothetical protein [Pseudomonas phage PseuGes_254]
MDILLAPVMSLWLVLNVYFAFEDDNYRAGHVIVSIGLIICILVEGSKL